MTGPYYSVGEILQILQGVGTLVLVIFGGYAAMQIKITAARAEKTDDKVTEATTKLDAIKDQNDGHQSKLIEQLETSQKLLVAMAARLPPDQVSAAKSEAEAPSRPADARTRASDGKPDPMGDP